MTACPVPFERLVALLVGELDEADASACDEHIFGCDACAAAAERLASLTLALREVIPPVISRAYRERLIAKGTRVQLTHVDADHPSHARFAADIDLLVHVLRGDLSRAERVDVEILAPDGTPRASVPYVPFDGVAGEVLIACQRHYEQWGDPIFRVLAFEGGERRRVGDYTVRHVWR